MLTSSSTTRTRSAEPSARVRSAAGAVLMATACIPRLWVSCEEPTRRPCGLRCHAQGQHRWSRQHASMSDTEPTRAQPDPQPEQPEPVAAPAAAPAAPPPVQRTRVRDLVFGLRSVVAVAVAGVIVGGLGGVALPATAFLDRGVPLGSLC